MHLTRLTSYRKVQVHNILISFVYGFLLVLWIIDHILTAKVKLFFTLSLKHCGYKNFGQHLLYSGTKICNCDLKIYNCKVSLLRECQIPKWMTKFGKVLPPLLHFLSIHINYYFECQNWRIKSQFCALAIKHWNGLQIWFFNLFHWFVKLDVQLKLLWEIFYVPTFDLGSFHQPVLLHIRISSEHCENHSWQFCYWSLNTG